MYDGTLGTKGPWEALVAFQQMIVLADRKGVIDMTPEALARRTTIPLEIIQKGVRALEEPDSDSRTPGEDGRRIVRLSESRDWGWQIVNYEHYRQLRTADERREYHRQYGRTRSQQISTNSTIATNSTDVEGDVDVDADAKADAKNRTPSRGAARKVVRAFCDRQPNPATWEALLAGYIDGLGTEGGKAATIEQIAQSCNEAAALNGDMTPRRFRRVLAQVMEPKRGNVSRGSSQRERLKDV